MTGENTPTVFIWDLDGTLYPKNAAYYEADYRAVAQAISDMQIAVFEDALREAQQSKRERGATYKVFIEKYHADFALLDKLFCKYMLSDTSFLISSQEVITAFDSLPPTIIHVVLSHAPRVWVCAALQKMGLDRFFTQNNLFCAEHISNRKNAGAEPFLAVCQALDVDPVACTVIEDDVDNLVFPKQIGMKTVYIFGQDEFAVHQEAELVDRSCATIEGFLTQSI